MFYLMPRMFSIFVLIDWDIENSDEQTSDSYMPTNLSSKPYDNKTKWGVKSPLLYFAVWGLQ